MPGEFLQSFLVTTNSLDIPSGIPPGDNQEFLQKYFENIIRNSREIFLRLPGNFTQEVARQFLQEFPGNSSKSSYSNLPTVSLEFLQVFLENSSSILPDFFSRKSRKFFGNPPEVLRGFLQEFPRFLPVLLEVLQRFPGHSSRSSSGISIRVYWEFHGNSFMRFSEILQAVPWQFP